MGCRQETQLLIIVQYMLEGWESSEDYLVALKTAWEPSMRLYTNSMLTKEEVRGGHPRVHVRIKLSREEVLCLSFFVLRRFYTWDVFYACWTFFILGRFIFKRRCFV